MSPSGRRPRKLLAGMALATLALAVDGCSDGAPDEREIDNSRRVVTMLRGGKSRKEIGEMLKRGADTPTGEPPSVPRDHPTPASGKFKKKR